MKSAFIEQQAIPAAKTPVWLFLAGAIAVLCTFASRLPAWQFMGVLAISVFFSLKWITLANSQIISQATASRQLAYLAFWPGMNPTAFCGHVPVARPRSSEWFWATAKTLLGAMLILAVAPAFIERHELLAGWIGGAGLLFVLHFGLFHLLSLFWRERGVAAEPIMKAPILATSLSDFWGHRWNLAFRNFAHALVFRPLLRRLGIAKSTMAVFLVSGVIHDLVISIPARGGWGLPTLYFLIQGGALLMERSRLGKRLSLNRGIMGRVFCALVVLTPAGLLFHPPFIRRVIVPMLHVIIG